MMRRLAIAGVAVGALIAAGALLANVGPTATLATERSSTGMAAHLLANGPGPTTPGTPGRFARGRGGRRGFVGFGRVLSVTGVNGNTITATRRGGRTVTVQVSTTTTYTEAGASASLAAIHPGSFIVVRGSRAGTSAITINATRVTILLSREAGVVTNVNVSDNTITLTGFDGASHTVIVTGQTSYQKAGASATLSDVTAGTAIMAAGTLDSSGTLTAVRVAIRVPTVAGEVTAVSTAVSGSSYTVTARFGTIYTVSATSSTTYVNRDGTAASASAVTVGTYIAAQGTLSGTTLTAQRIIVVPAGTDRGFDFGRGGPGFGPGHAGAGSAGPTAPTTPATHSV